MGRKLQIFVQISNAIQKHRRLANLVWRNARDAQQCGQFFSVDEGEHIKGRFAMVDGTGYRIDMGEDEIHRFLGEVIERFALGDNIPK